MRILKPSWAHERTTNALDPSQAQAAARTGRRDVVTRTTRGLGRGAKLAAADSPSRAEERWMALLKQGLVDLDVVPTLRSRREEGGSAGSDAVESYVIARVESGATIRAMLAGEGHSAEDVMRAMARLTARELLKLI